MKKLTPALSLTFALTLSPLTVPLVAQEMRGPGPQHETLKKMEGTWLAVASSMGQESRGTMVCKMECGGLWLATDYQGEFAGMTFQGRGLDGYDPQKGKYVSVWVDSMSTRPILFEGDMDEAKKTLTLIGDGIGMDGQPAKFKSVSQKLDDDHMLFKMLLIGSDGTETELLTINYTRKK